MPSGVGYFRFDPGYKGPVGQGSVSRPKALPKPVLTQNAPYRKT